MARAQHRTRPYRSVSVDGGEDGYTVCLDGRPLRTPARRPLTLPTRALAEAVAAEWEAQSGTPRPDTMPLTRLAATAVDRVPGRRREVVDAVAAYAATDLVCHRAPGPPVLAARERDEWGPLLDWLAGRYGARLAVTEGVIAADQPEDAVAALRRAVAGFDDAGLAALQVIVAACGSLVIALALADGRIDADEAWRLSRIDETYQAEQWGEDAEAAKRSAAMRAEVAAAARFLALAGG